MAKNLFRKSVIQYVGHSVSVVITLSEEGKTLITSNCDDLPLRVIDIINNAHKEINAELIRTACIKAIKG